MTDGPQYLTFEISLESHRVRLPMWKGGETEKLYLAWRETNSDEDFEALAEWLHEDIQREIDFYVEDIT